MPRPPAHVQDLLLLVAGETPVRLETEGVELLHQLVALGFLRLVDPPRKDLLEAQYEALQEQHRKLVEAKVCLERLQQRLEPRPRLGGLLPSSSPNRLESSDVDVQTLFRQLTELELQVKDLDHPRDLVARLGKVRERLQAEDRHCLDRLGAVDRQLNALGDAPSQGVRVDPVGFATLTETGRQALPEGGLLRDLEAVLNVVSGPRRHKVEDYAHFRDDPATLLVHILTCGLPPAQAVAAFEGLAEGLDRHGPAAGARSARLLNTILVRLMRRFRGELDRAYPWCGRDRLLGLLELGQGLEPGAEVGKEVLLLLGLDVRIAFGTEASFAESLYPWVRDGLRAHGWVRGLTEAGRIRLTVALLHALMAREITGPLLREGFLQRAVSTLLQATEGSSRPMPTPDARAHFGFQLAALADFQAQKLTPVRELHGEVVRALDPDQRLPMAVVLQAQEVLARMCRLGETPTPQFYGQTFQRIRTWLRSQRDLGRSLQGDAVRVEDEAFLAANLTGLALFREAEPWAHPRILPGLGIAAAYEDHTRPSPPLLGEAFGSLLLT